MKSRLDGELASLHGRHPRQNIRTLALGHLKDIWVRDRK